MRVRLELQTSRVLAVGVSLAAPYVAETTRRALNLGRINSPVDKGIMRASHQMTMRARRTYVAGRVTVPAKYAHFVHDGTRPHVIQPKRKKALKFMSRTKGRYIIVRKVNHPGTRARPWLWRALVQAAVPRGFAVTRSVVYRSSSALVG